MEGAHTQTERQYNTKRDAPEREKAYDDPYDDLEGAREETTRRYTNRRIGRKQMPMQKGGDFGWR